MTIILITIILILLFGLTCSVFKNLKPDTGWDYKIVDKKNRGPNVDQGYWATKDALGREVWFTDDALKTARERAYNLSKK